MGGNLSKIIQKSLSFRTMHLKIFSFFGSGIFHGVQGIYQCLKLPNLAKLSKKIIHYSDRLSAFIG